MHVAGNSDEWFYASMGINKERTDARGRATGSYLMSTKGNVTQSDKESLWTFLFQGIKYFGGGSSPREPHRWSHVCLGVRYTAAGTAERTIFADGEHNFNFTSAFLPASSWPRSRSFTFGGREVETRYTSMTIIHLLVRSATPVSTSTAT